MCSFHMLLVAIAAHILHHSLVAKIKAEKAYELVGWALPTYPSLSKVQDVRLVICKGFRRVYVS